MTESLVAHWLKDLRGLGKPPTIGGTRRRLSRLSLPFQNTNEFLGPIRKVRFTKSTLRQASMREKKGPSVGKIQVKSPHQRSPYAMKFEDRSYEETERQQRWARSKAWNLAKTETRSKRTTMLHSTRPRKNGYTQLRQQKSWRKESL